MKLRGKQQGVSAIMAVVLIVIMALIGTYLATITGTQSMSTTLSDLATQARFASATGIEWGTHQAVTNSNSCPASPSYGNCTTPSASTSISPQGAATGFNVVVECLCTEIQEGPDTYNIYRLFSTASRGSPGEMGYVMRRIRATVTDLP